MVIRKNGKGVIILDAGSFEFVTQGAWDAKVKDAWRNGYNYVTGEVYNKTLGKLVSSAQKSLGKLNGLDGIF